MIVGVLGGGQLGRMLALAGYPLGLRFRFLDPNPEAPAGAVGELLVARYEDRAALARLADGADVVTYEFENVPVGAVEEIGLRTPIYPPAGALACAQDRWNEKRLFAELGIPVPPFFAVEGRGQFDAALAKLGYPVVLKTRRFGYDGKGQEVIRTAEDAEYAWQAFHTTPLLVEAYVPFERELSLLAVRGRNGATAFYPLVENKHERGILRRSIAPAPDVSGQIQTLAEGFGRRVLEALEYVGVLAIEFFQHEGRLLANEMAPRVHNSGHWTIEGAVTSQFENHLRAVLGWPLGETTALGNCAMFNLISDAPPMERLLAVRGAHVHLYGKAPRPGRKIGHVTLRSADGFHVAEVESLLRSRR